MSALASSVPAKRAATAVGVSAPAVLVADTSRHVVAANKPACALLDRRRADLLGSDLSEFGLTPLALARIYADVDERGTASGTAGVRRAGGPTIPIRYKVARIEGDDEAAVYLWVAQPRRQSPRTAGLRAERRRSARAFRVTERELEVVRLIAAGLGNREIARELTVSLETVKTHVRRLLPKLSARGRAHAVAIAWRHDLLD